LERLESREVPAYLVVTNTSSGSNVPDSLAYDIAYMNMKHDSSNTITFDSGLSGPIDIPGTISLSLNVTIDGNGSDAPITGNNTFQIFYIGSSATVTLKNLQITDGKAVGGGESGGGICNTGTLTLTSCSVYGNTAPGAGGGIFNSGTLTISQSSISNNSAQMGGGITNCGTLTTDDTTSHIDWNQSTAYGGGLYNETGTATISGYMTVDHNTAGSYGGGICNWDGSFSMSGGEVDENSAATDGGGVYGEADLTLDGVELGYNSASRNGGGVYQDARTMTCTSCIFLGNTAGNVGPSGSWTAGATISGVSGSGFVQA
jgi:fibronectin-binding autotransporter adhesin